MIEDNPTNLQLMVYLLTAFGHEVLEAHEGSEGVDLARREKPELVLLDMHMPRMDGYEVARHLRADAACSRIPLVAVTALAMVGDREKILAAGFSGYIAKPLEPETFLGLVQRFLAPEQHATLRPAATALRGNGREEGVARAKRPVVLFVDNCPTNVHLIRSTLEPCGYHVLTALSANEGLSLAKRTRPDLILSDVHMPYPDGYAFMRMVQADSELCKIPFVFLSSSVWSIREQETALEWGAQKFLARPIEPQQLLAEIEECLSTRRRG